MEASLLPTLLLSVYLASEGLNYQDPAKFHIGMLTISLLVGLAYAGYLCYTHWMEKDTLVGYVRNLVIALVCRAFFSILFDGVILLGTLTDVGGGNTLLAFEQISAALVLAFWLTLTIYLHARVQRDFNSEPTLKVYQYGVPGVALFFAFVWIFTLQDQHPNLLWWLVQLVQVYSRWMVNGAYLLFLLIQLGLVSDIARMMITKKSSLDNDSVMLFMRVGIIMGALVLIFWLQFGLYLGRMPLWNSTSYVYFDYFIDGFEGTLICICLYFFLKWVPAFTNSKFPGTETTTVSDITAEERIPDGRGITTVDSIFVTRQSGRISISQEDGRNDVVYSNVVEPERLKNTLELYNRFDVIPKKIVTVVDGEEFHDCLIPTSLKYETEAIKPSQQNIFNETNKKFMPQKSKVRTQKRNAFYSSKYLILDQKDVEIPKYLETRPSISSTSDTPKEEHINVLSNIPVYELNEMVNKWLSGNAEDMRGSVKTQPEPRGHVEEKKSKDAHFIDNENRIPSPQKSEKKTELVTPDIVIDVDPQSPKPETPEKVNDHNKNEKIISSTIASKLVEKIGLSIPSPTSEKLSEQPASLQQPKNETDSAKLQETKEEPQHQTTTLSGKYLTYSELLEFRKHRDSTTHSPQASKRSSGMSETIFSLINSLINIREIFDFRGHTDEPEVAEESPCTQQEKSIPIESTKSDETIKTPEKLISLPDNHQGIHTKHISENSEVSTSKQIKELKQSENIEGQLNLIPNAPGLLKDETVTLLSDVSPEDLAKSNENRSITEKEPEPNKPNIISEEPEYLKLEHVLSIDLLIHDKSLHPRPPELKKIDDKHSHPKETLRTGSEDHECTDDNINEKTKETHQQTEHLPKLDPDVSRMSPDLLKEPHPKVEYASDETETKHLETSEIDSENDITEPGTEEEETEDTLKMGKTTEERLLGGGGTKTIASIFATRSSKTSVQVTKRKNVSTKKREVGSKPKSSRINQEDNKLYLDSINNPPAKPTEAVEPVKDNKNLTPRQIYKETSESSDSEFSIERTKSSRGTFSLTDYYNGVIAARSKITTLQHFPHFNNSSTISTA